MLINKLMEIAIIKKWDMGITDQLQPNKSWVVDLLTTYKPDDEVFDKGYLAPPIKKKLEEHNTVVVP